MLHHHHVANHQIRGDEARQLITRGVPWLDAEERANWTALSDFNPALGDELTHLQGNEARRLLRARSQDESSFRQK